MLDGLMQGADRDLVKKFPTLPSHPEWVCWGCDLYRTAKDLRCGAC
jgi:hypothetical protein